MDGKKTKSVPVGKTAKAKGQKYKIKYGKGVTKKLEKGKTYCVEVAMEKDWEEDDEDIEDSISGWLMKRKVKITK